MEGSPRRAFKPKWSPSAVADANGGSDTGRVPPHSDDAEKAVLGSMLASPDAVTGAIEILSTDAFYDPRHAKIWRAMTELFERSAPIDLVTVAEELKRRNDFEAVGGYSYLTSLDQHVTHAGNVESHAKIVQEKQTLRRMIDVSRSIVDAAYEQKEEARVLLDSAEQRVFEIANDQMRSGFVAMNKLVLQGFSAIEEYRQRKVHVTGTPTGYYDLDEMT
ncbi:MAG TPA: DnaB-like helicase N-terminal domain-containing protein, partial [Candidatus Eisenbacteria bacterium]|nr:DnaB-like helicase N-terminal domain-containing protein [Candidatus Eisenbacteria bacterium]